jgi:hypothetical protein
MSVLQRSWADIEELDDTEFYQEFEKTIKIFGKVHIDKNFPKLQVKDQYVEVVKESVVEVAEVAMPVATSVAEIATNITEVAEIATNITEVAEIATNITEVAEIATNITEVAEIATPETTVPVDSLTMNRYVDAVKGPTSTKEYVDVVRGHITEKVPIEPEPIVEVIEKIVEPPTRPKRVPKKFTEADLSKIKNLMILKN